MKKQCSRSVVKQVVVAVSSGSGILSLSNILKITETLGYQCVNFRSYVFKLEISKT